VKHSILCAATLLLALPGTAGAGETARPDSPNVVLILADDK